MHKTFHPYRLTFFIAIVINLMACSKEAGEAGETGETPAPFTPPVATPVITAIFPAKAGGGDTITLKGKNLPSDISSIKITLNKIALKVLKATTDSLQAEVPLMAGSGKMTMTVGAKTYESPELTYDYEVIVTTVAGNGNTGNDDGAPEYATFNCPWGIAVDANDNLFVADSYNRLIRKIAAIDHTVSSYSIPSLLDTSHFYSPYNIAVDKVTNDIYMTDFNENLMRRDAAGNMSVIYSAEMPLAGIAIAPDRKNLFISNNVKGTIIKTDMDGKNASVFTSGLITPRNIIFNNQGKMFVAAYPGPIYEISNTRTPTMVAGQAGFKGWEVATDTLGNFFLADHFDNSIKMVDLSGKMVTIAGSGTAADIDGTGLAASFNGPMGITIDSKGNLFVTTYNFDTKGGNKVRKITIR